MDRTICLKKIMSIIDEKGHDISEVTEQTELKDYIDSLDKVEIGMEIEKQFDLTLPEDTEYEWKTIGDMVNSVMDIKSNS